MPVALTPDDPSQGHFRDGFGTRVPPLTYKDDQILRHAGRYAKNPEGSQDKIMKKFGMHAPEFWSRVQALADHPDLSKRRKDRYSQLMSTPGPMTGGASILDSKQFSHGVNW